MVESIFKLLKISGSIKTLLLRNTPFMKSAGIDFFKALGENKTLEYINMDCTAHISFGQGAENLAKAIAMNKYKNGALHSVSIRNLLNFNTTNNQHKFF